MEILTEKDFKPQIVEQSPNMVVFKNDTKEDFTYSFNKVAKTFPAGTSILMERGMAEHFAKHLANRELLNEGRENHTSPKRNMQGNYEDAFFLGWFNKFILSVPTSTEPIIEKAKEESEPTKKKVGRPKIKKEEEFEEVPVPDDDSN